MIKFTSNIIRKMWLDFFHSKNHYKLPSLSLIPINDPTLLWINSGVATLKHYFNGQNVPPFKRLTNLQRSIRTNDIENVGYTSHHNTLFEMLGNFSIGDYFKKEAIIYAWEFLTDKKWIGFDSTKLYVTVYKDDKESYEIWYNIIGLNSKQIIKGNKDTNFWEIGEGPCGPNSEIFYDRGEKYDPEQLGLKLLQCNLKNERYLEIWNIVFSQYNKNSDFTYTDLPQKNIDTGLGLERIASILQKTPTNFETDLFMPIIKKIEKIINGKFFYNKNDFFIKDLQQSKINVAFKIIADHIRAIIFMIADGAFPSNKDRGYVIRRLIRRSILYGKKINITEPFLFKLVKIVIKIMQKYYFYLIEKQQIIEQIIFYEEEKFLKTLKQGNKFFNEIKTKFGFFSKENTFLLFESYGFPIELIEEKAKEDGIKIDLVGFNNLLENAKIISRINKKNKKIINLQNNFFIKLDLTKQFDYYEQEKIYNSEIIFMFIKKKQVTELTNTTGYIILKKTPFYAEKGGQVSDRGVLLKRNTNTIAYVLDVQQENNKYNIHFVKVNGTLKIGDFVDALININRRFYIRKNHSGTHIIYYALRKILGKHVMQMGSYNDDKHLHIDITHNKQITLDEIISIENLVIKIIKEAIPCEVVYTDIKTALNVYNSLALFTEKYNNKVRIIKFGNYSCELCGGTHVSNTIDIEDLLITNIESKGFGIFRIYAITSNRTITKYLKNQFLKEKTELTNCINEYNNKKEKLCDQNLEKIWKQINNLIISKINLKKLKKLVEKFNIFFKFWQKKYENILIKEFIEQNNNLLPKEKNKINILTHKFTKKINFIALKKLINNYKINYKKLIIFFALINNDKIILIISITNDLQNYYKAEKIIKKLNILFDGKGGGNNNIAQNCFNFNIKNNNNLDKLLLDPLNFLQNYE